ncbi:type 1 glutamine amidotransferase domain-containing protein [Zobellia galactanivorans]|uniref:Intracellular peptidase, family C56 n=1 Tax=Zobellia galactanivorans (strain DSM 12802 / CCUG 47099 / CIP 106680 / NCIMB 13871 / Dsij) TaxID=63186 RepID=G0LB91_ZOBGA|nr:MULTISPECIES: type 1 glutamine amidotransferase domain-containing protein [Zobellia]MBU3026617.1 type 1 glutamine amidotransferase [Zobellia galactanivorans]MDO6809241.1 type 1 glutamine amidotransferase domain-containing protein [Zobellia galactanivorans]OWW26890.1 protease [Zobellia sp. OII3]CAZ95878.1 Intracellular peptidase, family C56 [Zobellia galactanivorans]
MKRIAILATNGFEESELKSPKEAMEKEGFQVDIVSLESGEIKGWADGNWSNSYKVDKTIDQVAAKDYNALMLPGGVINPDKLRREGKVLTFVRDFFKQEKPVAAICHASWTLISAEVVKGRKMTSFHSIKDDLVNAGAHWVDEEVVVDQGFVTSRNPDDLPAFNSKLVEEIKEGKHEEQHA